MIAYHIDSVPEGMTIYEVLELYYATQVLLYQNRKPYKIDKENLDQDIAIINPYKNEDNV